MEEVAEEHAPTGSVVNALSSQQCEPGSIPGDDTIDGKLSPGGTLRSVIPGPPGFLPTERPHQCVDLYLQANEIDL